jgi:murein DD-endopeptidase MepM/ murein hydrolase activator NlpD
MRNVFYLALAAAVIAIAAVVLAGATPVVKLERPLQALGAATPVAVKVFDKNGVRYFRARLEQGGRSFVALEQASGGSRWSFRRQRQPVAEYHFVAGRKSMPGLQDGLARMVLEARSDDWRGSTTTETIDLEVRSVPPPLRVDGAQHYINQGGAEMVVFTTSAEAAESGVQVGPYRFRSWPLPGAPGARFALFGYPYDLPPAETPLVYARDVAGNEATAMFWFRVFPKKFRNRDFELTESFLRKVTPSIRPYAPQLSFTGDLLQDYLKINGELRRQNNRQLADLRFKTAERFLWSKPFRQLADSQVEAQFADHRRYFYKGSQVDEQDHLGFDLAKTANTPIVASNDGTVVFANFLGIYGNCVVIDHGCGLQSIYGHLSAIEVKEGQTVRQGEEIGRSGSTGLAGGDHLHFSMQIDGVQVNPTEWWDEHWIHDRILLKFPGGKLPAAAANSAPAGAVGNSGTGRGSDRAG